MFGSSLGFQEILVICVILIVVVGPDRLPAMMKGVGKALRTMREASREIRTTVGIDEMMREDVLRPPPPRPRPVPAATVARAAALPAAAPAPDAQAANAPPAPVTAEASSVALTAIKPPAAPEPVAVPPPAAPPAPAAEPQPSEPKTS
jgi:sec-independent protein translocase protein TatB